MSFKKFIHSLILSSLLTTPAFADKIHDLYLKTNAEDLFQKNGVSLIRSKAAIVVDDATGKTLYEKNSHLVHPVASITKLMTAIIVLESGDDLSEKVQITSDDVDLIKGSSSRVPVGAIFTRMELLNLSLMSSDNRAAHAIGRSHRKGIDAFVTEMNRKATLLGMKHSKFLEPTGLNPGNVSTISDLILLAKDASKHKEISNFSSTPAKFINVKGIPVEFKNTNSIVREGEWNVILSKTGYISEAGRCLVMMVELGGRVVVIATLEASASAARASDAKLLLRNSYAKLGFSSILPVAMIHKSMSIKAIKAIKAVKAVKERKLKIGNKNIKGKEIEKRVQNSKHRVKNRS